MMNIALITRFIRYLLPLPSKEWACFLPSLSLRPTMAEPAGEDDDNSHRQSPRIEEEQLNHSPSPVLPSDHEEEIAEDEIGERLPPPVTPVPRFRNLSAEPANPATPLLLDSGGMDTDINLTW